MVHQHLLAGFERTRAPSGFAHDGAGVTDGLVGVEFPGCAVVKAAALAKVV